MSRRGRYFGIALLSAALAVLAWYFVPRGGRERKPDAPATAPAAQAGNVSLSRVMQENGGIETASPTPFTYREETQAYVTVLDPAGLTDLQKNYLTAKAVAEKTKANLGATRAEYERMKKLYKEKNISAKAFQAAQASFLADEADAAAANEIVRTTGLNASQQWGGKIAGWIKSGSDQYIRLARREDALLQITLPQGYIATHAPAGLKLILSSGKPVPVELVSIAPRTDPRIQGQSFFYIASRESGLIPGMRASAVFPSGQPVSGLLIPESAVVWWQGRAWTYVRTGPDTFTRREVGTEEPVTGGWFVREGFSARDQIVVKGAETLLSQEFLAKPAGRKEEDED